MLAAERLRLQIDKLKADLDEARGTVDRLTLALKFVYVCYNLLKRLREAEKAAGGASEKELQEAVARGWLHSHVIVDAGSGSG